MSASPQLAVDTSIAVPLLVASHVQHRAVAEWASGRALTLSGHALIETYSVLTRLPGDARVSPEDAVTLIEDNFGDPLILSASATRRVPRDLASAGVAGGAAYDGLVAIAALEHGATLVTRDARARSTYEALGAQVRVLADEA
ncbi:PilT protein domain-containing protein [Acidipropionibacterium acidipropionici ATCC 4875]|uniref:Ribonuclease VapC n=1 Tax=Acidipropionibacterium acidipropionici (strain ATCC 4875 / DSM 20272 / JCM 6432 / NBRC 12425 / NCIMB 8070 / 4) TaxID=1171373 RepID=K7SPA7_ACIA4|nr:PIN domain-containing protein [Acidipropionibacterium acidipropionici]AFV91065.1 PilT protein domain-containing protein [Acidipropionibacterium acidipropionici ATCC 4875]